MAERNGLTVVAVYTDNDSSASSNSRKVRPQFDAMLAAADRGEFQAVVAYSMSRLTRRPAEWETLIDLARRTGIEFFYNVSPRYDLNTADGRATARTVAAWDAAEAERTSERRAQGNAAKIKKGYPLGRPRVFGFEPDGITPRESEAAIIRAAYDSIIDGATVHAITRAWNNAGSRTTRVMGGKKAEEAEALRQAAISRGQTIPWHWEPVAIGGKWSVVAVRNTLLRERNAGILVANGERQPESKITALVPIDTWETARAILTTSRPQRQGRVSADRYLSGIAECSCGQSMVVGASWSKGVYSPAYVCREIARAARTPGTKTPPGHARIKAEIAEAAIPHEVVMALAQRSPAGGSTPERRALVAQRADLAQQADRAKALYAEFGGAEDIARARRLKAEHDALSERIDSLAADSGHAPLVAAARAVLERVDAAIEGVLSDALADAEFQSRLSAFVGAQEAFEAHWKGLAAEDRKNLVRATLAVVRINPAKSDRPRLETVPRALSEPR